MEYGIKNVQVIAFSIHNSFLHYSFSSSQFITLFHFHLNCLICSQISVGVASICERLDYSIDAYYLPPTYPY